MLFCSRTSRRVHIGCSRRHGHPVRFQQQQPAGVSHSTGDDPARPRSHAGSQTGYAASAASSRHAESSSTSFPLSSTHAPANDAQRTHVSTGQVQNAHGLSSSWPSFPSTSFYGTRGHGWQRRKAFPKWEARVWVPTLPQRAVVEVGWTTDLRGEDAEPLWWILMSIRTSGSKRTALDNWGRRNVCWDFIFHHRTFS